jgi:DNA-binding beta-propeller fold protein YncE
MATSVASIAFEADPARADATGTSIAQPKIEAPTMRVPAVVFRGVGLVTPESVLYDSADDLYLASNVNGLPLEKDGNGFISQLSPDGTVKALKWIEGGMNGVTLNAPKGSAIVGDVLYVADIDTLRTFDRTSGAPKGDLKIPGATFLNDVAAGPNGLVYVSDSGLRAGANGFDSTGTDAVYAYDPQQKKLTTLAKTKDLHRPNGIAVAPDGKVWVATFGDSEIFWLDARGDRKNVTRLPKGQLDGILFLPAGDMLVSSWAASAIYRGRPGATFAPVVTEVKSPADIGFDAKRNRIMVPLFQLDEIQVWDIRTSAP